MPVRDPTEWGWGRGVAMGGCGYAERGRGKPERRGFYEFTEQGTDQGSGDVWDTVLGAELQGSMLHAYN